MNRLHVGLKNDIELPKGSFLYIDDELPEHPKAKIFQPGFDAFNPLKNISKKDARNVARALYASPEGQSTLTVRNGRRALSRALAHGPRLDQLTITSKIKGVKEEVEEMIDDLLFTDIARDTLCSESEFAFTGHNRKVFARLNRAELGDDDSLTIGLFLIAHYDGQLIIPAFEFYARPPHIALIRENRLIAGVRTLSQIKDHALRDECLLMEKIGSRTTVSDAKVLMDYEGTPENEQEQRLRELIR